MRTLTCFLAIALGSTALCQSLKVVTTTQDLAAIAKAVGGSKVSVTSLVAGARDPHRLDAKPSYMSRVAQADLFIAVGLDLEIGYEQAILSGSRNRRVAKGQPGHLYAHEGGVRLLEVPTTGVTRAQGDIHPYGNPHYWLDPWNARIMARSIAERMAKLRPSDSAAFRANAAAFVKGVDERMFGEKALAAHGAETLWGWSNQGTVAAKAGASLGGWTGTMAPFKGRPILVYHRSWSYFADRFDLRVVGELEPKPGLDPTPGHIQSMVQVGKREGVKAILQEPYYSDKAAKFVAQRIAATPTIIPLSVGQDPAAKDYLSLIDTIVSRVAAALRN